MEIERIPQSFVLDVRDSSHVGEARRRSIALAQAYGLSETLSGTVGIIVTELTNNLVRHATEGLLALQWITTSLGDAVEILSLDQGPGMNNVAQCLQDGYTTGGTPGTGLGAVKRLSGEFDVYSVPGKGTVIVSRVFAEPARGRVNGRSVRWSAFSRPAPGEAVCGDIWRVVYSAERASFLVCDGLGHGPSAALAAEAVADTFARYPSLAPAQFLEAAHKEIGDTRGAAVAVAQLDVSSGNTNFAGIGNISATLLNGDTSKGMFSHNGTVGVQMRKVQAFDYTWPVEGLLVMNSDGIHSRWSLTDYPGLHTCHPAIVAAVLARDFKRGRDDLTVLVAKLEA